MERARGPFQPFVYFLFLVFFSLNSARMHFVWTMAGIVCSPVIWNVRCEWWKLWSKAEGVSTRGPGRATYQAFVASRTVASTMFPPKLMLVECFTCTSIEFAVYFNCRVASHLSLSIAILPSSSQPAILALVVCMHSEWSLRRPTTFHTSRTWTFPGIARIHSIERIASYQTNVAPGLTCTQKAHFRPCALFFILFLCFIPSAIWGNRGNKFICICRRNAEGTDGMSGWPARVNDGCCLTIAIAVAALHYIYCHAGVLMQVLLTSPRTRIAHPVSSA